MLLIELFIVFAALYVLIEIMYDNTSHRSMAFVGGMVGLLTRPIYLSNMHYGLKMVLITVIILVLEYISGRIWNKNYTIWDYRKIPFNLHGHICLRFGLLWFFVFTHIILYVHGRL